MIESSERDGRGTVPPARVTLLRGTANAAADRRDVVDTDHYALAELERRHERTDRMIRKAREQLQ